MRDKLFIFLGFFCAVILTLSLRGRLGNFTAADLLTPHWAEGGPFELSVERGRFALTYSLVEDKSFQFSLPVARFATPDLGYKDGRYVSLFAPGLSILLIPGYLIGKFLGAAQIGTFAVISLFALANCLLIYLTSRRLGAGSSASSLAGLIFLFATPAFPYAVSLYQHHVSTFLILASLFTLLASTNLWVTALVWFFIAAAVPIDYPNLFLLFPLAVFSLQRIITLRWPKVSLRPLGLLTFLAASLPLSLFFWFNSRSYANPFQLAGTVAQVKAIDAAGRPTAPRDADPQQVQEFTRPDQKADRSPLRYFKPRNLINGFYLQIISPDRGLIHFAPVILTGVVGAYLMYHRKHPAFPILFSIGAVNFLLYAMWGDPWGGWAFGSRYLIPAYAILSLFIAVALSTFSRHFFFLSLFAALALYSLAVNAAGAITSNANPPQVEVLALEKVTGHEEKYTYRRNQDHIAAGRIKSAFYQHLASRFLSPQTFYYLLVTLLSIVVLALTGNVYVHSYDRR